MGMGPNYVECTRPHKGTNNGNGEQTNNFVEHVYFDELNMTTLIKLCMQDGTTHLVDASVVLPTKGVALGLTTDHQLTIRQSATTKEPFHVGVVVEIHRGAMGWITPSSSHHVHPPRTRGHHQTRIHI